MQAQNVDDHQRCLFSENFTDTEKQCALVDFSVTRLGGWHADALASHDAQLGCMWWVAVWQCSFGGTPTLLPALTSCQLHRRPPPSLGEETISGECVLILLSATALRFVIFSVNCGQPVCLHTCSWETIALINRPVCTAGRQLLRSPSDRFPASTTSQRLQATSSTDDGHVQQMQDLCIHVCARSFKLARSCMIGQLDVASAYVVADAKVSFDTPPRMFNLRCFSMRTGTRTCTRACEVL